MTSVGTNSEEGRVVAEAVREQIEPALQDKTVICLTREREALLFDESLDYLFGRGRIRDFKVVTEMDELYGAIEDYTEKNGDIDNLVLLANLSGEIGKEGRHQIRTLFGLLEPAGVSVGLIYYSIDTDKYRHGESPRKKGFERVPIVEAHTGIHEGREMYAVLEKIVRGEDARTRLVRVNPNDPNDNRVRYTSIPEKRQQP